MLEQILKYLGYGKNKPDDRVMNLINECIEEVEEISKFKYVYNEYDELLPFIKENEAYLEFLKGSNGYLLVATTLGIEVDNRTRYYKHTDPTRGLIFDACASAYVEKMADDYEASLPFSNLSFRFCPGYQGTSFLDNQIIAKYLNVSKYPGISFVESGLMVPLKSMIGIIAIGSNKRQSCKGCIFNGNCKFQKEGLTCYKK